MVTKFLQSLYNGEPFNQVMLDGCIRVIEQERIGPQVLSILGGSPPSRSLVPASFVESLTHLRDKTVGQNFLVRFHQSRVFNVLEEHGIPAITIKGTVFAERFFGDFAARPTSDIDLFINSRYLDKAILCLRELGFEGPFQHNPLHFHCLMQKRIQSGVGVLNIELHWSLVHENNASPCWQKFWGDAMPLRGYTFIQELSVQHTFYTICLHGANHKMRSLKYVLDVAHLLFRHRSEIDLHGLLEMAEADGTLRRVRAVLNTVYREFPSLDVVKPLPYRRIEPPLIDSLILRVPMFTPDSWRLRFGIVREWLWPRREVAMWYTRTDSHITPSNLYWRFYRQRLMHLARTLHLIGAPAIHVRKERKPSAQS